MDEGKDVSVVTVIHDAIKKHHVKLENPLDPNIQALVSYAMTVGYHMAWKEWKSAHPQTPQTKG